MKRKLLALLLAVVTLLAVAIPCFAATIEQYTYNGVSLPKLPDSDRDFARIFEKEGKFYLWLTYEPANLGKADDLTITGMGQNLYKVSDGAWVEYTPTLIAGCTLYWSNYDVTNSEGELTFKGTDIVRTLIEKADMSDLKSPLEAMAQELTVKNVVIVLSLLVGACAGFAFMWWGVRKLTRAVMTAFKKGRVSI